MKKGKEKRRSYIKKGEKGLKNASFWAIKSKKKLLARELHLYVHDREGKIYRLTRTEHGADPENSAPPPQQHYDQMIYQ